MERELDGVLFFLLIEKLTKEIHDMVGVYNNGAMKHDRMAVLAFTAGIAFYFVHRKLDQEHEDLIRLQEGTVATTKKSSGHHDADAAPIIIHSDEVAHQVVHQNGPELFMDKHEPRQYP